MKTTTTTTMSLINNERIINVFNKMLESDPDTLKNNNTFIIPEEDVQTSPTQKTWCVSTKFCRIVSNKTIRSWALNRAKKWRENYGFRGDAYIVRIRKDGTMSYDMVTV